MIAISINGTEHQFEQTISVTALIEHMQLGNKRIALERNGEIVPRGQFNSQMLADGDKLSLTDSMIASLAHVIDYDNTPVNSATRITERVDNRVLLSVGWSF